MKARITPERGALIFCSLLIVCVILAQLFLVNRKEYRMPHLRAVIDLECLSGGSQLHAGYNYDLFKRFTAAHGAMADIRASHKLKSSLDSLRAGSIDVVMIPQCRSIQADSCFICMELDSTCVWIFHERQSSEAEALRKWFASYSDTEEFLHRRQPFFDIYNPSKRVSADFISPYDSLVKAYADSIHWDWKLFSAVMYSESRFHIEARSPRGAAGLMQIMPKTAAIYGCTDPLDPEQNISAGAMLLSTLTDRYAGQAKDRKEQIKFALAAFNAGTGRVQDCIEYASHKGVYTGSWDSVASVISEMSSDMEVTDSLNIKQFKGNETVSFVKNVLATWQRYCRICP